MTKILKNRIVIMVFSIVLALLFLLIYTKSVQSEANKVEIIRMAANVAKGEVITDKDIVTVSVGGYNLDKTVMSSAKDVIGKYAATDLVSGALVMKANLSDNILSSTNRLEQLDGTRVAYSISIKDFSDGLSDKLISGDVVSLYVNQGGKPSMPPELTYVEVLASTTNKGVDREDREKEGDTLATVILLVTPKQALLLTDYEDNAEIHMALVYRGDHDTAKQFLDKQNEVLSHEQK